MKKITDTPVPVLIWTNDIEDEAVNQLRNVSTLPIMYHHVAAMADVHAGKGSTIGSVIATDKAVIPAAIGVDIGCGMSALRFPFFANELKDIKDLRHSIERSIPTGRNGNRDISERVQAAHLALGLPTTISKPNKLYKNSLHQFGSLGGGNHFIEICIDEENRVWAMLHSGSRNIGKELADKHIKTAQEVMGDKLKELPDKELAYLLEGTKEFDDYIGDMDWSQNYAKGNRHEMMLKVVKDVSHHVYGDARLTKDFGSFFLIDCHHNYCTRETHFGKEVWVTRKGAVSAREGEYGIIPGSMGTKSYIVRGKGNPDAFHSCSHGAGRKMSRTQARNTFTQEDLDRETQGIECRKDRGVLDEIPSAYKSIDEVMENQKDLVEKVHELRQVLCIKG